MSEKVIYLDDEATWPEAVLAVLTAQFSELAKYEAERTRLDKLSQGGDMNIRLNRPMNPHGGAYEQTLSEIAAGIASKHLAGYHGTRLHTDEIADILKNGMRPLSPELLAERVTRRRDAGDISPNIATRLLSEHQGNDENRAKMIWFAFDRAALRDEWGFIRLFSSWGGEALYCGHEEDDETGPVLRAIGEPCIIEAAVPIDSIETFCEVARRFYDMYMSCRNVSTTHGPGMEGYVTHALPVRRIIRVSEAEFERLTNFSAWDKPS